jgi:hypothetical protein
MANITSEEIFTSVFYILCINIIITIFLFSWATDDDLNNIPKEPLDRFISLFYYSMTTFTTTGYGDIYAKSNRMKIVISLYMIFVFAITVSLLFRVPKISSEQFSFDRLSKVIQGR